MERPNVTLLEIRVAWQARLVVLVKIVVSNIKPGTRRVGHQRNLQKLGNFKLHTDAVACRTGLIGHRAL